MLVGVAFSFRFEKLNTINFPQQFTVHMLLQCRFHDPRLEFDPSVHNVTEIVGTRQLSQLLWTPHVYFHNERHSVVMGPGGSDVMTHVIHDGTVLYTKR